MEIQYRECAISKCFCPWNPTLRDRRKRIINRKSNSLVQAHLNLIEKHSKPNRKRQNPNKLRLNNDSRIVPVADDYFEFGILQDTSNGRLLNEFLKKKRQRGLKRQKLFETSHKSDEEDYGSFDINIKRTNTNVPPPNVQQSEMPPPEVPSSSRPLQAPRTVTSSLARQLHDCILRKSTPAAAVVETPSANPNASMLVSTPNSQQRVNHMFDATLFSPIKRSAPTKSPSVVVQRTSIKQPSTSRSNNSQNHHAKESANVQQTSIGKPSTSRSDTSPTAQKKHVIVKPIMRSCVPLLTGIQALNRSPVKYRKSLQPTSHLNLTDDEADDESSSEFDNSQEEEVEVPKNKSNRRMSAANEAQKGDAFVRSHHSAGGSNQKILESENENLELAPVNTSALEMQILQNQQNSRSPERTPRSHQKTQESVPKSILKQKNGHRTTTSFHRRLFIEDGDEVANILKRVSFIEAPISFVPSPVSPQLILNVEEDEPEHIEPTQLLPQATTSNRSSLIQRRKSIQEIVHEQCDPESIHESLVRKLNKPMPQSKRDTILALLEANNTRKVQGLENETGEYMSPSSVVSSAEEQQSPEIQAPQGQRCRTIDDIEAEIAAMHAPAAPAVKTLHPTVSSSASSVYYEVPETQESPLNGSSSRFSPPISQQVLASPMSDGSIYLDTAYENVRKTLLSQSTASPSQQTLSKAGDEFVLPSQPVAKKVRKAKDPLLESVVVAQQSLLKKRTLPKKKSSSAVSSFKRTLFSSQIEEPDDVQTIERKSLAEIKNKQRTTAEPSKTKIAKMQKKDKNLITDSDEDTEFFVPSLHVKTSTTAKILPSKQKRTGEAQSDAVSNAKPNTKKSTTDFNDENEILHQPTEAPAAHSSTKEQNRAAEVQNDDIPTMETRAKKKQKQEKSKRKKPIQDSDDGNGEAAPRSPIKKSRIAQSQDDDSDSADNAAAKRTKAKANKDKDKRNKQAMDTVEEVPTNSAAASKPGTSNQETTDAEEPDNDGLRRSTRERQPPICYWTLAKEPIKYMEWDEIAKICKEEQKAKEKKKKVKREQKNTAAGYSGADNNVRHPVAVPLQRIDEESSIDDTNQNPQPSTTASVKKKMTRGELNRRRDRPRKLLKPLQGGTSDSEAPIEIDQVLEVPVAQKDMSQIALQLSQVTNANTIQDIINESQSASRKVTSTTQNTRSKRTRQTKRAEKQRTDSSDSGVNSVITSPSNWIKLLTDFDSLNEKAISMAVAEDEFFTVSGLENLQFMRKGDYDICRYLNDNSAEQYGYLRFRPHGKKSASKSQNNDTRFLVLRGEVNLVMRDNCVLAKEGSFLCVKSGERYAVVNEQDYPAVVFYIKIQVS